MFRLSDCGLAICILLRTKSKLCIYFLRAVAARRTIDLKMQLQRLIFCRSWLLRHFKSFGDIADACVPLPTAPLLAWNDPGCVCRCVSMDNRRRPVVSKVIPALNLSFTTPAIKCSFALQGWGYVEFREASSASAAQAAMDGAVLPPPAPQPRPRSPHREPQHGRLLEMGFKAQARCP